MTNNIFFKKKRKDYGILLSVLFTFTQVKMWITFNEPFETCVTGYGLGEYAPRLHLDGVGDYLCGHTILRAHARAYRLYHHKYAATQKGQDHHLKDPDF